MATKIICCSFEPNSIGGFMTICNGVKHSRPEHFSKTVAVTKEAFIAACKDRVLFNDILGVDIRHGWQNALASAIQPYVTMKETFDPETAAQVSSELDVQIRGEDAVNADIATVEEENAALEQEVQKKRGRKKKEEVVEEEPGQPAEPEVPAEDTPVAEDAPVAETAEPETPAKPTLLEGDQGQPVPQPEEPVAQEPETEEAKDGQGTVETTDNGSQDARGESDSELPVDGPRAESAQ
jgi:hypothetical protein